MSRLFFIFPLALFLASVTGCKGEPPSSIDGTESAGIHTVATSLDVVTAIEAFDLDRDGDQDIVAMGRTGEAMYWYEQLDDGDFEEHLIAEAMHESFDIDLVDFDDDGDIDIVTLSEQASLVVLVNSAAAGALPVFDVQVIDDSIPYCYEFCEVAILDIDQNGLLDIVACEIQNCFSYEFSAIDSWQFTKRELPQNGIFVTNLVAQDIDKDGFFDLTFNVRAENYLHVVKNNALGVVDFTSRESWPVQHGYNAASFDDINGDGIVDIALGTGFLIRMEDARFFNSTSQAVRFEYPIVETGVPFYPVTSSAKITDIDGDGDNDIVSGGVRGAYHYHENTGSDELFFGGIDPRGVKPLYYNELDINDQFTVARPVRVQDINQNGLPDLLLNHLVDGQIFWADIDYLKRLRGE